MILEHLIRYVRLRKGGDWLLFYLLSFIIFVHR